MKMAMIVTMSLLLVGCPSKSRPDLEDHEGTKQENAQKTVSEEGKRETKYEMWSKEIGGQFWPFDLKEYVLQEREADIVNGLGGRWISVRYLLREGHNVTREEMLERITQSLKFYEWSHRDLPEGKYVLSVIYETSQSDLHFTRGPFSSSDHVLQYEITIHISADASVLVLYCEAIW